MVVRGQVADVELRELPRDMTALVLFIHDPMPPEIPPPSPPVPAALNLAQPLSPIPDNLLQAAPTIDRNNLDREQFRQHYFELKSTGARVLALGNYLAGNGASELASGTAQLAAGLQTFADGYQAIAELPPDSSTPFTLENEPSERIAALKPTQFDLHLNAAADALRHLADNLVNNREQLLTGELTLDGDSLDQKAGFVLISAGNLYDAAAWRDRGDDNLEAAELNRQMSLAYQAFGKGINELNAAGNSLSLSSRNHAAALAPASIPVVTTGAARPTLKCAVVGWNRRILDDAAKRLRSLGNVPVDVQGTVLRGNFREEIDQTWIAMETVSIDGLAIDLNYDDDSNSTRSVNDVYRWITETAN
jgi:X-X-X-Leu-X-X-Gly heptad repeat protein